LKFHFRDLPSADPKTAVDNALHRIQSPGSWQGTLLSFLVGFLFTNLLIIWLIVSSLLALQLDIHPSEGIALPWVPVAVALILSVPIHECLHMIWHPGHGLSSQTVLVMWPEKLRFGVYYEGCMPLRRWMMMRLSPLLFLSVLPTLVLTISHYLPVSMALLIFLQVLMLVNGLGSGGDIVAVMAVLRQVPQNSEICFVQGLAYWRCPAPDMR
jgi:hypothetical protein